MNTRLQGGTSVTEWITGTDLVELQIKCTRRRISNQTRRLEIKGHAMEYVCMRRSYE
jgi:propionyl-CoA carboxylase alpha chain